MKAQLKIAGLVIAALAGSTAFAAADLQKAATRIEFNNMIDHNNKEKTQLQQTVANKMAVEPEDDAKADQKKVLDLVDVEVGVGEDRPVVVDRRYNSVGEPIVDKTFSNAKVQLVDDNEVDHGS